MSMHVARTLRAYPREAFGLFVLAVAAFFAVLGLALPSSPLSGTALASTGTRVVVTPLGPPPAPEPLTFKDVAPADARTMNAVMPFSAAPNPAARPLLAKFGDPTQEGRALDCLTAAVYYEAAIETVEGQRAVAQVVLNRLRHPAYPKTVCGVVFQGSERATGCQFTFTCDGALSRAPAPALWTKARAVAWGALTGQVFAPVGWATHYHTDWVVPYWASSLAKAAKVGTHIFYRWNGGWGRPIAFTGRYAGLEPGVTKMAALSGAHGDAQVDVAVAAGNALDELALTDEIVIKTSDDARQTMKLNTAAAAPGAFVANKPIVTATKPEEAKVPPELRWALTGAGPSAPEPALGTPTAAVSPAAKDCVGATKETKVAVPGAAGTKAPAIKVRERCGA